MAHAERRAVEMDKYNTIQCNTVIYYALNRFLQGRN